MSPAKMPKKVFENNHRVLIAEDHAATRKCLKDQLGSIGFDVVAAAATGEGAITLYKELKPNLLVTELKIPKVDGIQAAKAITSERPVPIILITGHSTKTLADKAIEIGVFSYLMKPVEKTELLP